MNINKKQVYKLLSYIFIILFGIGWIINLFYHNQFLKDAYLVFVVLYAWTRLSYYRLEVKDKDREIEELKKQISQLQ